MNAIGNAFYHPISERLGWSLIHQLWQGAFVAILLAALLRLLRRRSANSRYVATYAAILSLPALLMTTFLMLPKPTDSAKKTVQTQKPILSERMGTQETQESPEAAITISLDDAPQSLQLSTPEIRLVADNAKPMDQQSEITINSSPATPIPSRSEEPRSPVSFRERVTERIEPLLPWVVAGWITGLFVLSAWNLRGWFGLQRLRHDGVSPVPESVQAILSRLQKRFAIRQPVTLLQSSRVTVLSLLGLFQPMILLPGSVLAGMTPQQLEAVLAHELAHIRRHDYLLNLLQTAVETFLFFHPVVWWMSRRIRIERENCCDDLALTVANDRLLYAQSLTRLEELRQETIAARTAALTLAASGGSLQGRIRRVLGVPRKRSPSRMHVVGVSGLSGVLTIVAALLMLMPGVMPQTPVDSANAAIALNDDDPQAKTTTIDFGKNLIQFEKHDLDQLPAKLFMVGFYPTRETPSLKSVYKQRLNGRIGVGHFELVGRVPGVISSGAELEPISYTRTKDNITARIRYLHPEREGRFSTHAYYFSAALPQKRGQDLPPGTYNVQVLFEDYRKTVDGKIAPITDRKKPALKPLTCQFEVKAKPAPKALDLGKDKFTVEINPVDKNKGGIFAIGSYRVAGKVPDAKTLYEWRLDKRVPDGSLEFVGRVPRFFPMGSTYRVLRFSHSGKKITARVECEVPQANLSVGLQTVYFRGQLPQAGGTSTLPAGEYDIEVVFENAKGTPVFNPRIQPITCRFVVAKTFAVKAIDLETTSVRFETPMLGKNPAGLFAITRDPNEKNPTVKGRYEQCLNGNIADGDDQLVGRLPGMFGENDRLEVERFERVGGILTLMIRHIPIVRPRVQTAPPAPRSAFFVADLPHPLPAGNYLAQVRINDREAKRKPALSCSVQILNDETSAELKTLAKAAIAIKANGPLGRPRGSDQNPIELDLSRILKLTGQDKDRASFRDSHQQFANSVNALVKAKRTWGLSALLDHPNVDAKILAAEGLGKLADPNAVSVLLAAAKNNNHLVSGSENATLHSIYRSSLTIALQKSTGLTLGSRPLKHRFDFDPSEVNFTKVDDWLDAVYLPNTPVGDLPPKSKTDETAALETASKVTTAKRESDTTQPIPMLARLVNNADRIVVATASRQSKELGGQLILRPTQPLKGIRHLSHREVIHNIEGMQEFPTGKRERWVFFLRSEEEGHPSPRLYGSNAKGWFLPYSDQLADKIHAAILLPKQWSEIQGGLRIGLRLPAARAGIGEAFRLEVCLQNAGKLPITIFQHRYNIYDYWPATQFEVTSPDGKNWRLLKPEGAINEYDAPSLLTLKPGESYIHTMRLSHWQTRDPAKPLQTFKQNIFDSPGEYSIRCIYDVPVVDGKSNSWSGRLVSKPISLLVVRNAKKKAGNNAGVANPPQSGLEIHAKAPTQIEQGMPLSVKLECRSNPIKLAKGVNQLNTFLHDAFMELRLTDRRTGKTISVKPYDPTSGMLARDVGKSTVRLDGKPIPAWNVVFPLATVYNSLAAGEYDCRVQFTFPQRKTSYWRETEAQWKAAGFWHGTVVSPVFSLKIMADAGNKKKWLLPKQLRVENRLVQLREDDPQKTAIPFVVFNKEDAEEIRLRVRNGHTIGARYSRNGTAFMLTAPPHPSDGSSIDRWPAGQTKKASYTIEIFETSERPRHLWRPGPGRGGYKVLWKKAFEVSLPSSAQENKSQDAALPLRSLNAPNQLGESAKIKMKIADNELAFRLLLQAAGNLPVLPGPWGKTVNGLRCRITELSLEKQRFTIEIQNQSDKHRAVFTAPESDKGHYDSILLEWAFYEPGQMPKWEKVLFTQSEPVVPRQVMLAPGKSLNRSSSIVRNTPGSLLKIRYANVIETGPLALPANQPEAAIQKKTPTRIEYLQNQIPGLLKEAEGLRAVGRLKDAEEHVEKAAYRLRQLQELQRKQRETNDLGKGRTRK